MKTIFITSFFGLVARNILTTDVLKILRNKDDLRIIILAPESKQSLYQNEFGSKNVIIEGIKDKQVSKMEIFLNLIFLNASFDTGAGRARRIIKIKEDKNYVGFAFYFLLAKMSTIKSFRHFLRQLYGFLTPKIVFEEYFKRYNPDLVFATDIFEADDIELIREARNRNVFTIGMIRSWDNPTTKGLNKVIPDKLVVNTEATKQEAIRYCDIKSENIYVVGVPHYDKYILDKRNSKKEVFKDLGLDSNKKTIFFAPPADLYAQGDPVSVQVIKSLVELNNVQIIIRLRIVGEVNVSEINPIQNKIAIDDPGLKESFREADLIAGDSHLADLLYHSDVVIAFASTLAIDAVVFNKPVVFIGFSGDDRPYWKSLARFYDYDHQRSILETGGVKLAKNMRDLMDYIKMYLKSPDLDKEGRDEIVKQRCWKLDGKSGERLANLILKYL